MAFAIGYKYNSFYRKQLRAFAEVRCQFYWMRAEKIIFLFALRRPDSYTARPSSPLRPSGGSMGSALVLLWWFSSSDYRAVTGGSLCAQTGYVCNKENGRAVRLCLQLWRSLRYTTVTACLR